MVEKNVVGFVSVLRDAGLQVSVAESIDAVNALKVVPLQGLNVMKASLKATLVKSESDCPVFEAVFDEYFIGSARALAAGAHADEAAPGEGQHDPGLYGLDDADLAEMLREALSSGSEDEIAAMARMAAAGIGQTEGGFGGKGRPLSVMAGSGYYIFRALEWLKYRELEAELRELAASGELAPGIPPVLALDELEERMARFRMELEREVLRRIAAVRGEQAARKKRRLPTRPEEVDFTSATLKQVEDMRRILPALARRLAARLARKNSAGRSGRVDIRNTLRHSLSTGGVPVDIKYRKRVPARPELFVLCDISGSVRTFSTFTLQLVYSLHQQFRQVRSFAFIDRVDEVTDCFNTQDMEKAVERAYREADVVDGDGHSDVGRALDLFSMEHLDDLSPRSTVLILSDARNNGKDPRAFALERMHEKTRRVYWLNPEPRNRWDTGDSIMYRYEDHCHSVHECRNLKQLAEFVYRRS